MSTWIQVIFGGLGVAIAAAALLIAYFAWIRPHAPVDEPDRPRDPPPAPSPTSPFSPPSRGSTPTTRAGTPLTQVTPVAGGAAVESRAGDLLMACATGESRDRQRSVEYDVLGRYAAVRADLRVAAARDDETTLQFKIFADGREIANHLVTKAAPARVDTAIPDVRRLRLQLTCQLPDGQIELGDALLAR